MPFFLQSLLSCLGQEQGSLVKLVNRDEKPRRCVFCNVSRSRGFDVVWESPTLVVFRDRNPGAREHLLVVPVKHIRNVKELCSNDIPLLQEMQQAGHRALDTLDIPQDSRRLGFHIPPFNSVMHLHLHVLGLPFRSVYRRTKYPISEGASGETKGFSWFVQIDQAIRILERGRKIGVFSC